MFTNGINIHKRNERTSERKRKEKRAMRISDKYSSASSCFRLAHSVVSFKTSHWRLVCSLLATDARNHAQLSIKPRNMDEIDGNLYFFIYINKSVRHNRSEVIWKWWIRGNLVKLCLVRADRSGLFLIFCIFHFISHFLRLFHRFSCVWKFITSTSRKWIARCVHCVHNATVCRSWRKMSN